MKKYLSIYVFTLLHFIKSEIQPTQCFWGNSNLNTHYTIFNFGCDFDPPFVGSTDTIVAHMSPHYAEAKCKFDNNCCDIVVIT